MVIVMLEFKPQQLDKEEAKKLISGLIVPRPVILVTTLSPEGVLNCAPFSFFQAVCWKPPLVSLSITRRYSGRKDTLKNILLSTEFVVNVARPEHVNKVELSAEDYPPDVSEVKETGLKTIDSSEIEVPGLQGFPIRLECRLKDQISLAAGAATVVFAEIITAHVDEEIFVRKTGKVNPQKLNPLLRTGKDLYAQIGEKAELVERL